MIFIAGDCHCSRQRVFEKNKNRMIHTDWSMAASRMRYLYDPSHRGFTKEGFTDFILEQPWKPNDCLLLSLGGNDLNEVIHGLTLVDIDAWIDIYKHWVKEFIDPIPIPKNQKGLLFVWRQHLQADSTQWLDNPKIPGGWKIRIGKFLEITPLKRFLEYYDELSEEIQKLAAEHEYRFLRFEVPKPMRRDHIHLKADAQKQFFIAWDKWGWQYKKNEKV